MTATATISELDAARAEHTAAVAGWRAVQEREQRLRRDRVWVDDHGREQRVDDEPTWVVAAAELEDAKRGAARDLRRATDTLRAQQVVEANRLLSELAPQHAEAVARVDAHRLRLERAVAVLVAEAWRYGELLGPERALASRLVSAADAAAPDDETRAITRADASAEVPTHVDEHGRPDRRTDRAQVELFGGASDLRRTTFWEGLGELARAGRKRGATHGGVLLELVEQELKIEHEV